MLSYAEDFLQQSWFWKAPKFHSFQHNNAFAIKVMKGRKSIDKAEVDDD